MSVRNLDFPKVLLNLVISVHEVQMQIGSKNGNSKLLTEIKYKVNTVAQELKSANNNLAALSQSVQIFIHGINQSGYVEKWEMYRMMLQLTVKTVLL